MTLSGLARALCAGAVLAVTLASPAWSASGTWERSWGRDVLTSGGTGFEICTVAASCKKGSSGGSLGGELNGLDATAVDAAGNVYVSNSGDGRVEKYDGAGHFEAAWGLDVVNGGGTGYEVCTVAANCKSTGTNDGTGGAFTSPDGIAVTSDAVWVADSQFHRIQKFDLAGHFELAIGKNVIKAGEPEDVGDVFEICTIASHCLGNETGSKGGEFFGSDIATDAAGNLYEADASSNRIQKFDSSGHFVAVWGMNVAGGMGYEICTVAAVCQLGAPLNFGGTLNDPEGIAADASGNVYVGNVNFSRIDKFSSSGTWLRAWGQDVIQGGSTGYEICTVLADCKTGVQGGAGGQMGGPYGLAVGAPNRVYEADGVNHRIQVFDTSGNFIAAWGADVVAGNADTGVEICTVAADCKAATNGGLLTGLGGELWDPHGISIGCGDALYVANTTSMRVERFGDAAPGPTCGGGTGGGGGGGGGGGPAPLPLPFILSGCLNTDANASGKALGPAKLGLKTKAQRAIFAGADLHSRKGLDRYCAAGGGAFRIGYPTKKLLKAAGRKLAKKIKGRVVLIETSSKRFSVAGIHVGDKASTLHGKPRKIGRNTWHLLNGPNGTRQLVMTKDGKVVALGIGDARLLKTKKLAKTYLTAWKLS